MCNDRVRGEVSRRLDAESIQRSIVCWLRDRAKNWLTLKIPCLLNDRSENRHCL